MPEKDPALWAASWNALPEPIKGAVLGTAVAFLRVMYDDKEPRLVRRLLESALCGAIALCVSGIAEAAGMPPGTATFAGGAVGLFGADQVRIWARAIARRRLDIEKDRDQ